MRNDYRWFRQAQETDWSGKRILVAGGTGFIGTVFVAVLAELGAQVFVLTRRTLASTDRITYLHDADLDNAETLARYAGQAHYDAAVYLAARIPFAGGVKEDYPAAKRSTLDPLVNFCQCFTPNFDRLIFASSVDAIGLCGTESFDEATAPNAPTPYGLAKYCGELYARGICGAAHKHCTVLRFAQVYGPGEPMIKIIPKLCAAVQSGAPFTLTTTGEERRRYLHLDDAVQSLVRSLMTDRDRIYNIAGGEVTTMNALIALVQEVYEQPLNLTRLNRQAGLDNLPCIAAAEAELGYAPEVTLQAGLTAIKEGAR